MKKEEIKKLFRRLNEELVKGIIKTGDIIEMCKRIAEIAELTESGDSKIEPPESEILQQLEEEILKENRLMEIVLTSLEKYTEQLEPEPEPEIKSGGLTQLIERVRQLQKTTEEKPESLTTPEETKVEVPEIPEEEITAETPKATEVPKVIRPETETTEEKPKKPGLKEILFGKTESTKELERIRSGKEEEAREFTGTEVSCPPIPKSFDKKLISHIEWIPEIGMEQIIYLGPVDFERWKDSNIRYLSTSPRWIAWRPIPLAKEEDLETQENARKLIRTKTIHFKVGELPDLFYLLLLYYRRNIEKLNTGELKKLELEGIWIRSQTLYKDNLYFTILLLKKNIYVSYHNPGDRKTCIVPIGELKT